MTTYYTLPDGRQTTDYQCWKSANAEHTAVQAAFDARFGSALSTPESRRAALESMRAHALRNSGIENIAPAVPRFQGGLTEAQVERRVDVAMTGTVHRNGSVGFAVPSANEPVMSDADGMPPGAVRVSFFGGIPQS